MATARPVRHLAELGEPVIEVHRPAAQPPSRPARKAGAKSDPIDAKRAARDSLARASWPTQDRRTTGDAADAADRPPGRDLGRHRARGQLFALVMATAKVVRARFRGQNTRAMLTTAVRLRPAAASGDGEVSTALTVLRDPARRSPAHSTSWPSAACNTTREPAPTRSAAAPKARRPRDHTLPQALHRPRSLPTRV